MASQNPQPAAGHEQERGVAFISYAREDANFALRLDESLRLKGIDVRGDWGLVKGAGYEEQLRVFVMESDAFVFVITPQSAGSAACRHEVNLAVEMKKRILPVVHQDCDENSLHPALRSPQWTFIRDSDDFVNGVQGLIEAINTDFDLLPEHRRLLTAAEEWQRFGRQKSYLLRKEGLRKAEHWLTQTSLQPNKLPKPTSLQSEYILASRRARTKGARVAFVVVAAVALIMSLLAVVALAQRTVAKRNEQTAKEKETLALKNEALALKNEQEANEQRKQADANAAEARYQEGVARTNEARAKEQQQIAEDNAAEARRQQKMAEDNAEEARRQKGMAVANAEEAVRRLIRLNMANGVQRLDREDYPGAAVWFGEALRLTTGDQKDARIRIAALLGEYPQVEQAFLGDAPIRSAIYSPDGRRVVTTHADRTARVWDAGTGDTLLPPLAHKGSVSSAAFSPDGRKLVTVSLGKMMDLNDPSRRGRDPKMGEALKFIRQLPEDEKALVKLEPLLGDEKALEEFRKKFEQADVDEAERMLNEHPYIRAVWQVMSPMMDVGYFQVWDVESGRAVTKRLKDNFAVEHAEYSRDGKHLLAWGGGARMWNVGPDHALSHAGEAVGYSVQDAAISFDSSRYAVGSGGHVRVYDAATGASLFEVEANPGSTHSVQKVAFSPDGSLLAAGDNYGGVRLWDAKTGAPVNEASADRPLKLPAGISVLTFSPDSRLLLAGTGAINAGTFRLWETKNGSPVTEEQYVKYPLVTGEFSPDGARLLLTMREYSSGHAETLVWETPPPDASMPTMTMTMLKPPLMDTDFAVWHPAGRGILTTGPHTVARVWNVDGNPGLVPAHSEKGFNGPFAAQVEDGAMQVVDAEGRPIGRPIESTWRAPRTAVSADGKLVAAGRGYDGEQDGEGEVRVWDVATGQPVTPVIKQEFSPHHVEFSRDGKWLLTVCFDDNEYNGWARAWDARTGEPVGPKLAHDGVVISARFDPAGRRVVTASPDGSVIVWDALTGKEVGPRITHPPFARDAMFSPDGTLILTRGGREKYDDLRLWDARSRQPRTPPMVHPRVEGVSFSADGSFIASEGGEKVRLWITETGEPLSPFISGSGARWHVRDARLLVEPLRQGYYKAAWSQAHNTPLLWDLRPASGSKEHLTLLTEFIAGRRVDRAGALAELDAQALRRAWETLKAAGLRGR